MTLQSTAQIYKSQQRGLAENNLHRLYATFNFEGYHKPSRNAFGSLKVLNDETFAPLHELHRELKENELTLTIPLIGQLEFTLDGATKNIVPGEVIAVTSTNITIKNPYNDEFISYLYVTFSGYKGTRSTQFTSFNPRQKNTLQPLIKEDGLQAFIGIFDGRKEALYKLTKPEP